MDKEACHTADHGVAKSQTWLSDWNKLNWIVIIITLKKIFSKGNLSNQTNQQIWNTGKLYTNFFLMADEFSWTINIHFLPTCTQSFIVVVVQSCPTLQPHGLQMPGFPIYSLSYIWSIPNNTGIRGTNPPSPNSSHSWKSTQNSWLPENLTTEGSPRMAEE